MCNNSFFAVLQISSSKKYITTTLTEKWTNDQNIKNDTIKNITTIKNNEMINCCRNINILAKEKGI